MGYIIAGLLVGPNFTLFPTIIDIQSIKTWAEIGVIFLLFSLGLEFSFKKLVKVGGSASITAVFEVIAMLLIGYVTGSLLGWSRTDSIFLGGILSISSTTIIIRAFEELGIKSQKFAGLVFGILIVEDLVAILLLVLLSTLALSQNFAGVEMLLSIGKLGFFLALWFIAGIFLIPTFLKRAKKLMSDESLLVVAIALCLLMVVLAVKAGFSPALGAFVMGSILAETTFAERIEHLVNPVKNLFAAIFFVSVGMLIEPAMLKEYIGPILIITLVTVAGKLLSTTIGALISGQGLKHSIKAGMSLSQIGEFSFIIATLGVTLKVTSDFLYPIAVAVSAVTTFITPYFIRLSEPFYNFIERKLPESLLTGLKKYSANIQSASDEKEWKNVYKSILSTIAINAIIIIGIIVISSRYLAPFIMSIIANELAAKVTVAFITILFMSPFLWALVMRRIVSAEKYKQWINIGINKGPLIILVILRAFLAVFLVGFLLNQLFSPLVAFVSALLIILTVSFIFSRRVQVFYHLMERRFIKNLGARENQKEAGSMKEILPWDAHIAEYIVSPESEFIGKTLKSLALRESFGVNIARIERGSQIINIPRREEMLFPSDRIFVIGTDEQLVQFQSSLERVTSGSIEQSRDVTLQHFMIDADSSLLNKTIKESEFREKVHGLIVGIEREGTRILNPDSTMHFYAGDLVWVVGEEGIAERFSHEQP